MKHQKILITGASGQLGSVLTEALKTIVGKSRVLATDIRMNYSFDGCFEVLDATDFEVLNALVSKHKITQIYHLAAILSAKGEANPLGTWDINMKTLFNVLEVSRLQNIDKVFFPSSIAVYGNNVEKDKVSQFGVLQPTTVYGVSKVAGENWANYYFKKYGVDVRSLRYPGVIGYQTLAGGGTTDYAVDIFHKAINNEAFTCFLKPSTTLPMIYIDDAVRATIELMEAPKENITVRTSYNIAGMSFNPSELAGLIQKIYPEFKVAYLPDFRQDIADSWPHNVDDFHAKKDWGWCANYDIELMIQEMIRNLEIKKQLQTNNI